MQPNAVIWQQPARKIFLFLILENTSLHVCEHVLYLKMKCILPKLQHPDSSYTF